MMELEFVLRNQADSNLYFKRVYGKFVIFQKNNMELLTNKQKVGNI